MPPHCLILASGASVVAEGSWLMGPGFGFKMAYRAVFENATADYDSTRGAGALKVFQQGKGAQVIQCEGADGYVGELRHMVESIQAGRPPSVVTGEDGPGAVEICEAGERSVKTGQWVALAQGTSPGQPGGMRGRLRRHRCVP